ncbi:hypothetical protein C5167_005275 [Papaver somniferum]|uniref:GAGA-binding transcriptional activator n=1 Tax=Papaver somniferum TaxID=3469 RepID=A0A4Y7JAX7_PAPSO|nr:protein BASIC PENTACYSTEINE1-like [Papaver somniferum]RZC57967.1 hypothetical protein C5167_005275 [Papaver somniferum]
MDNLRNWHGYYEPPHRGHSGLNLSSPTERDTKPLFNNQHGGGIGRNHQVMVNNNMNNGGVYHPHRVVDIGMPETHLPHLNTSSVDFWLNQRQDVKVNMNGNHLNHMNHINSYGGLSEASGSHGLQNIPQQAEAMKVERMVPMEPPINGNGPLKKRPGGRAQKSPKPKKPKRVVPKDEDGIPTQRASRPARKSMGVNINGIDIDLSVIPIPVCSCTGAPQQCYRWGCGGWQSACCTTSISMYPLPMSNKRRGARIAGRKMSQGAFKKVLEKLATEGYSLSSPIDLRTHWAKHGTNKFVTIR